MSSLHTGSLTQEPTPLDLLTTETGSSPTSVDMDTESVDQLLSELGLERNLNQSSSMEATEEASETTVVSVLTSTELETLAMLLLSGGTATMDNIKDGESTPFQASQPTDNH